MKKIFYFILLLTLVSYSANAESITDNKKTVSVSGNCMTKVQNDRVKINVKVSILDKLSSEKAFADAQTINNNISTYISSLQIKDLKLETGSVNLFEDRTWNAETKKRDLDGYRAEILTIVDMPMTHKEYMSAIMDKVSSYRGVELDSFSLYVSSEVQKEAQNKCLAKSVKDAKHKAEEIVLASGSLLGDMLQANYNDYMNPSPVYLERGAVMAMNLKATNDSAPMNIKSSEQTISVRVDTTWEIK